VVADSSDAARLPEGVETQFQPTGGRWSVAVPIDLPERRQHVSNTERRGTPFDARTLRVWSGWGGPVSFSVSGPNVRANGTLGQWTLRERMRRADVEAQMPVTYALALDGLRLLARRVRADAEATVEAIKVAIAGEVADSDG
jgi:hypothetical protein